MAAVKMNQQRLELDQNENNSAAAKLVGGECDQQNDLFFAGNF